MAKGHRRPAWLEIDCKALEDNARVLSEVIAPSQLCAVVKADGYGHGAVESAKAFVRGGASWLAVAIAEEGIELRRAGISEPILLLSEPFSGGMEEAVVHDLVPTIYSHEGLNSLVSATNKLGESRKKTQVHVKVDTGMHRVGATSKEAADLITTIIQLDSVELSGLWTHFANADDLNDDYSLEQLSVFDSLLETLPSEIVEALSIHTCNSAAGVRYPMARRSMVRCGISLYGYLPFAPGSFPDLQLTSALSLKARVSFVKTLPKGSRLSYGLDYETQEDTVVATVPVGYADGIPRRFGRCGGEVIIRGKKVPVVGNVTMDQLLVDCGPDSQVMVGDEVVLLGNQSDQSITANDWASWLSVIVYEVICGFTGRLPRLI